MRMNIYRKQKKKRAELHVDGKIVSEVRSNPCGRMLNYIKQTNKFRGLSPRASYTDQATAACRRIWRQLLRIEGAT
jgi:hypothetical protein